MGSSYISEGQFAELIADCELKLIESNGAYRFVDSDGSGNMRESAENSIVHHFDGDITGLSSLIQDQAEDGGKNNMVNFIMTSLTEQSLPPEDQL